LQYLYNLAVSIMKETKKAPPPFFWLS